MEIIILISVYLLSVFTARYACIKTKSEHYMTAIMCIIPLVNILLSLSLILIYLDKNYIFDKNNIADWFFGIKKD